MTPHTVSRLVAIGVLGIFQVHSAQAQSVAAPSEAAAATQPTTTEASDDDGSLLLAEADYRVINLPTTLRVPRHGSNFQLTHRFNGNLELGNFGHQASELFGLDEGAVVGFEYRFGITPHIQAAAYRSAVDKTVQFYGKYDAVHQHDSTPVSVSALLSVEGAINFSERYSPALGAAVSRRVGDWLAVYATPMWAHNTAASLNVDRNTLFVGLGGRLRVSATVYLVGEVSPRLAGYAPDKPEFGFGVEKRVGAHMFQLNFTNSQGTTFGQTARGGLPNSLFLGFNLARKFY